MKTSNPFQIPSCFQQQADLERRRRERFRKGVVISVAGVAALLVVMLIEGCMSEHARTSTAAATPMSTEFAKAPASQPAAVEPKPVSPVPASLVVATTPVKLVAPVNAAPAVTSQPELIYVVKAGDTLSLIARLHQTSVKALKAVNGLNGDIIAIGARLKLPSA